VRRACRAAATPTPAMIQKMSTIAIWAG
jgi:hypothetical protein